MLEAAVCELQSGNDVADGVEARDVGLEALVGDNKSTVDGDTDLLEAKVCGRRATAHSDEQQFGLDRVAVLQCHNNTFVGLRHALEAHAEGELDSALAESTLELLADRLVLVRYKVRESFDDRHIGAPRLPHTRELNADDAAAKNSDLLRYEVQLEGLLGGNNTTADFEAGERSRVGAGRKNDVLAGDRLVADLDGRGRRQTTFALDRGDPACLDQALEALVLACDDALAVRGDRIDVNSLKRGLDSVLGGFARYVGNFSRVQQRLGRDTADVETRSTDLALFD